MNKMRNMTALAITGNIVKINYRNYSVEQLPELQDWCVALDITNWSLEDDNLIFENDEDAMLFYMAYSTPGPHFLFTFVGSYPLDAGVKIGRINP